MGSDKALLLERARVAERLDPILNKRIREVIEKIKHRTDEPSEKNLTIIHTYFGN